jgi:hypothetical protein
MTKLLAILLFVLILSGCTSAVVKTPAVTAESLLSDTAGVSKSPPLPQLGQSESLPQKFNVPTNVPVGAPNTNWPVYHLTCSSTPSYNCVYEWWTSAVLNAKFALAFISLSNNPVFTATNKCLFFKLSCLDTNSGLRVYCTNGII